MPKKESCISWCLYFLPIIFAIFALFILGNLLYLHNNTNEIDDSKRVMEYLEKSLTTNPIVGVKVI